MPIFLSKFSKCTIAARKGVAKCVLQSAGKKKVPSQSLEWTVKSFTLPLLFIEKHLLFISYFLLLPGRSCLDAGDSSTPSSWESEVPNTQISCLRIPMLSKELLQSCPRTLHFHMPCSVHPLLDTAWLNLWQANSHHFIFPGDPSALLGLFRSTEEVGLGMASPECPCVKPAWTGQ